MNKQRKPQKFKNGNQNPSKKGYGSLLINNVDSNYVLVNLEDGASTNKIVIESQNVVNSPVISLKRAADSSLNQKYSKVEKLSHSFSQRPKSFSVFTETKPHDLNNEIVYEKVPGNIPARSEQTVPKIFSFDLSGVSSPVVIPGIVLSHAVKRIQKVQRSYCRCQEKVRNFYLFAQVETEKLQ